MRPRRALDAGPDPRPPGRRSSSARPGSAVTMDAESPWTNAPPADLTRTGGTRNEGAVCSPARLTAAGPMAAKTQTESTAARRRGVMAVERARPTQVTGGTTDGGRLRGRVAWWLSRKGAERGHPLRRRQSGPDAFGARAARRTSSGPSRGSCGGFVQQPPCDGQPLIDVRFSGDQVGVVAAAQSHQLGRPAGTPSGRPLATSGGIGTSIPSLCPWRIHSIRAGCWVIGRTCRSMT
jgi:hypothetical protein